MDTEDKEDGSPRAMSRFLRHFTVVGDDHYKWNTRYKKWDNEDDEDEPPQMPTAPAPAAVAPGTESSPAEVPGEVVTPPKVPPDFRTVMRKIFSSHRFQVIIICLVIMDALLVLAELMLDLKIIQPDQDRYAARVFHYLSIAILTFFMIEVALKLYVFRMEFFYHKFEILDAVIVIISFVLDIVLLFQEHVFEALGLLILLRLWRVARIINGIIISVKTRSERQLSRLKMINHQLATKIQHLEFSCTEKEQEIERLNKLLRDHGLLE
ncbi:voltage-gated hydrogen channel 1 isoform X1 [Trichosurus vulpecula]|uniref:voltage-gated hydrogen channel 1 isoform X1 n=2 Tax=Trichosurus vulpecula TaxID=9337 RepID=UPI00186B47C7|nr:voltage-gated hydrogen channel 1 isoform X1 [Trichosurus vulpecula]XP_036597522.1 voltage-gated hydrogen channel 1 isoform X1 [Trichosurus vulpecula]